ncbi:dTDP-4-dehydrorhamnose reductase [Longibacter salinarum]|uniref:dTDP-4-dehydrorhamnose reductase n=1 Tax=Longibacter salinarum TaxID=1850348 RepID=A0A2A8CYX3_9BACT|nr:dTDP-4-dehydrorhamnose reductase [Longibacter salinarum]PEN13912.1 dTDP-4-dehydrorhamnose reductase [Longibacter salinarum]
MLYNRVLVTGANGLLGQALVQRLSRLPEYDVLATARDDGPRFDKGSFGYAPLDVTDASAVHRTFQDFTPNVVVNCAAVSSVGECRNHRERCWNVNAAAVETLANECRKIGARLVQVSTDFVFDGEDGPYDESARPDPVNYYGRSKLAGENAVRASGLGSWAIVRTILLYGTANRLSRSNFVLWVVNSLSRGETIHVVDDQYRTPTYVVDLATGIERLLHFEKDGVFHLSGRELVSVYDLACTVADVCDLDDTLIRPVSSDYFDDAVDRPLRTGFIILKGETELGYSPHSLRDGLAAVRDEMK